MKPKLFKQNNLWFCRHGNKLAVGETPKQAYATMKWMKTRETKTIIDDSLIFKEQQ